MKDEGFIEGGLVWTNEHAMVGVFSCQEPDVVPWFFTESSKKIVNLRELIAFDFLGLNDIFIVV